MEMPLPADFLNAAHIGDTPRMQALIARGIEKTTLEEALFISIQQKNITSSRFLLTQGGVNVNAHNKNGHSLLSFATHHNNILAISLLLDNPELDLNKDSELSTLEKLVSAQIYHLVEKIVTKAPPFYLEKHGKKALMAATLINNRDIVRLLIARGVPPSEGYILNKTPLHRAVEHNLSGTVKMLIEGGANVNIADNNKYTPLFIAISRGNFSMATFLEQRGASLEIACAVAKEVHYDGFECMVKSWKNTRNKKNQYTQPSKP